MDKKIRISIMVGETRYPLWVDPKEEPIFREAGRMISRRLVAYRTRYRGAADLSPYDMLAMAAIDLAADLQRRELDANPATASAELQDMVTDLQDFLGNESPTT